MSTSAAAPPLPAVRASQERSQCPDRAHRVAPWLPIVAALARVALGLVFLAAAGAKLADLDMANGQLTRGIHLFAASITAQHVLPSVLALPTAWGVVLAETAIGLWLLSHHRERAAVLAAGSLLGLFSVYLMLARVQSGNASCGCFGRVTSGDLTFALARNALLVLLAAPSLWCSRAGFKASSSSGSRSQSVP